MKKKTKITKSIDIKRIGLEPRYFYKHNAGDIVGFNKKDGCITHDDFEEILSDIVNEININISIYGNCRVNIKKMEINKKEVKKCQ